jgi:hypothetical protein
VPSTGPSNTPSTSLSTSTAHPVLKTGTTTLANSHPILYGHLTRPT